MRMAGSLGSVSARYSSSEFLICGASCIVEI
jgi:hypothetical protein